jgi:hypothetical protein
MLRQEFVRIDPKGRAALIKNGKDGVSEDEGDEGICAFSCSLLIFILVLRYFKKNLLLCSMLTAGAVLV